MNECPVCLQLCVHPSKLPCGHIFCFLCVKVSKLSAFVCVVCDLHLNIFFCFQTWKSKQKRYIFFSCVRLTGFEKSPLCNVPTRIPKWISRASAIANARTIDQQHRTKRIPMVLQRSQWCVFIRSAFLLNAKLNDRDCFILLLLKVGGNTMNERARKSKTHTKMHRNNAPFWLPAIYTSWTLIKCCKNVKQTRHASDKWNVGVIWWTFRNDQRDLIHFSLSILQVIKAMYRKKALLAYDCGKFQHTTWNLRWW